MQAGRFKRGQAKDWEEHKQVVGERVSSSIRKGVKGMALMRKCSVFFFFVRSHLYSY